MQRGEPCPKCAAPAGRPDVVWFGERPYHIEAIYHHLAKAELFAAIGTSGKLYPAAAFVQKAPTAGAHTIEINLGPSSVVSDFDETRFGRVTQTMPAWVDRLLDDR